MNTDLKYPYRIILNIFRGLGWQFLAMLSYVVMQSILIQNLDSIVYLQYFSLVSLATFLSQVSTAGLDGKIFAESIPLETSSMNGVPAIIRVFRYLPVAVFVIILVVTLQAYHILMPLLDSSSTTFLCLTIILQPLSANLICWGLANRRYQLVNMLNSYVWVVRLILILFLFKSNLLNLASFLRPSLPLLLFLHLMPLLVACIVALSYYLECQNLSERRSGQYADLAQLLSMFRSGEILTKISRFPFQYLLITLSEMAPLSLSPIILLFSPYSHEGTTFSAAIITYNIASTATYQFWVRGWLHNVLAARHDGMSMVRIFQTVSKPVLTYSVFLSSIFILSALFCTVHFSGPEHGDFSASLFYRLLIVMYLYSVIGLIAFPTKYPIEGCINLNTYSLIKAAIASVSLLAMILSVNTLGVLYGIVAIALVYPLSIAGFSYSSKKYIRSYHP